MIAPLRKKYPDVMFDGCLVAVTDAESAAMESTIKSGLFDALPVNTTAICCGDSMFFKPPHVIIEKARLAQEDTVIIGSSPEEYGVYLRNELDRWSKVIATAGLKPE